MDIYTAAEQEFYKASYLTLQCALNEVLNRLNTIRKYQMLTGRQDPIEHSKGRLKSAKSMCEKLERRGFERSIENALTKIHDAAGIRVVCRFIEDVYVVADMLARQEDIVVIEEKDYIKSPKENGYRSYHMIVQVPVIMPDGSHSVYVEIQIRTIAMDCWASLEHQIKYKKNIGNHAIIVSELKRCADEIASTDMTLQTIRELIHDSIKSDGDGR